MLHSVRHAITLVEELWSFLPLLFDTAGSGLLELIKSSKGHLSCFKCQSLRSRVESSFVLRRPASQRDVYHKESLQMVLYYCTANFYLVFKNPVFEDKVIISFFVKICKKFKFSESWHATLVSFAKTSQKLSLQKFSRKIIISTSSCQKRKPQVSSN